ncbi:hypothetical protein WJX73_004255 [Symbiochloris irregularis]|uniref:Heme haloperoxidase family profile domain-containing protein n=1 Tax=Symbiochloris irregularis TaxID=706552 RepID=A0AAW1PGY4_9CHLO
MGLHYDPDTLRSLDYPHTDTEVGLPNLIEALHNTSAGGFHASNVPYYLAPITKQTMLDSRAQCQQGFNAYRAKFGLPPLQRFEDFGLPANVTESLRRLYGDDINSVEYFVGIMLEKPPAEPALFAGETMTMLVGAFALSAILNLDFIKDPMLWSDELLTPSGKALINSLDTASLLQKYGGANVSACPFRTPDTLCPEAVQSITGYRWFNMYDYVGLDFVVDTIFTDGVYFHHIFNLVMISSISTILSFFGIHLFWLGLGKPNPLRALSLMNSNAALLDFDALCRTQSTEVPMSRAGSAAASSTAISGGT